MAPRASRRSHRLAAGPGRRVLAKLRAGILIPNPIPILIRSLVTPGHSPRDHPICSILNHVVQGPAASRWTTWSKMLTRVPSGAGRRLRRRVSP